MLARQMTDRAEIIARLEDLLVEHTLPRRDLETCARLVDTLKRPARVGLFGPEGNDNLAVLLSLLQADIEWPSIHWPTTEIGFGDTVHTTATFEDGSTVAEEGWPSGTLLSEGPIFLDIEAPYAPLDQMSFLQLQVGPTAPEQRGAFAWASQRTEISIWCTVSYTQLDRAIWTAAPPALKNRAFLAVTRDQPDSADAVGFGSTFFIAGKGTESGAVSSLRNRISRDIAEAHQADLDAAEVFLHRHSPAKAQLAAQQSAPQSITAKTEQEDPPEAQVATAAHVSPRANARVQSRPLPGPPPPEHARALLSEPLLYMKRRARALSVKLDWDECGDAWAEAVLEHCFETTEGLRDRTMDWPAEQDTFRDLQAMVDEACDTATLLQIETGPAQAEDAATLLQQIRDEFEHLLSA